MYTSSDCVDFLVLSDCSSKAIKTAETSIHETSNFFWAMAHWVYTAQYIYTALVLPFLFTQAKVEWFQEDLNSSGKLDFKKV